MAGGGKWGGVELEEANDYTRCNSRCFLTFFFVVVVFCFLRE